jgi:hypothetical protein
MSVPSDPKLDSLVASLEPTVAAMVKRLRKLVNSTAPELRECVKWGNPFWVGKKDCIVLMLYEDHVNLGFVRGVELLKKFPSLDGTGKSYRHVKIRSSRDALKPDLRRMIREAVKLDAS